MYNNQNIQFKELAEFTKEFGKLCKKFPTLEKDFLSFKNASLMVAPREHILIEWLGSDIIGEVYKVKKFRCQCISKNSTQSGIRVIYRYSEVTAEIEFIEITLSEIYYKGDKEKEDRERIKKYFKK